MKEYDIGEAQRQLAKAEAAWPGHPKLAALKHDIDDVAKRFQQPLDELNTLLAARMYFKADKVASDLLAKMPQLKIDGIRKTIKEKLDLAAKTMPKAGLDQFAKGDALVDVLEIVKDYRPALDALMGLPIKAPSRLIAAIDEEEHQSCHLSWTPSGSKGVTYVVVRKENGIPANNGDGKIVGSDISEPSFVDSSISPGSVYGYAVFGMRHGVCSSGASASIEVLTAIGKDTLLISSGDGLCKFSWTLPANADGVRILRREGSIPTSDKQAGTVVLSDLSLASYEDRSVKNGSTYGYCFQVAYHFGDSFKYSKGYSALVTPEAPPKVMTDISTKVSGQMVNISWECKQTNKWRVIAQEALSESSSLIGQVISLQELTRAIGGGKVLGEADASNKKMSFSLPENTAKLAALITVSGSNGVISQFIHISTVPKVLINKARTVVENINLKLVLETPLPKYLNRIFYLTSPKGVNDRTPPWAKPEDAKNGSMKAITPKQYLEDGLILVRNLPSQDIYVSVIGEYIIGGMTFYSDPEKLRVHNLEKETIEYEIAWGRGFLGRIRAEGAVLKITCKADFVPELALCYRDDGLVPLRIDDPNVKKICVIPEQASGYSGSQYSFPIPNGVWSSVRSGTALRILLKADDAKEFKLAPKNAGSLLVP